MLLSKTKKFMSKSISVVLAFILILIGFMFIVLGKYYQEKLNKEFNIQIDCKFVRIDNIDGIIKEYNSQIPERNKFQVFCFCKNIVDTKGFSTAYDYQFPEKNVFPCQNFVNKLLTYNSLTYLIMFMIPIINTIITVSLATLTSFEKNNNLTQDKLSNMIKIFIGQFFNTGLLLLIVNTRINVIKEWSNDFPVFTGLYSDFSPSWFLNIGCTIFFTMIISIFTIHVGPLINALIMFIKRCFDSGNQIGVGSKKNITTVFMKLYMGPDFLIDAKYAQVINEIFLNIILDFMYILCEYFILLWNAWIVYFFILNSFIMFLDRQIFMYIYLLKLVINWYRTPPNYNLELNVKFVNLLKYAVFLHTIFGIWMYGSDQILNDVRIY